MYFRALFVLAAVVMASCTSAADRLRNDPAAFDNPNGWGPRLIWVARLPTDGFAPSLGLSELDDHPDLPNYAIDLFCLGGGRLGLLASALVHGHMSPEPRAAQLSVSSREREWSAPAVWLENLMDDAAPAAEFTVRENDLRHLLSHPVSVRSGSQILTYPAPPPVMADQFVSACAKFEGRMTLDSLMPTVEVVSPGEP